MRAAQHRMERRSGRRGGSLGLSIKDTRALLDAALGGRLDGVETSVHPIFGLRVPRSCPGVDAAFLDPRTVWSDRDACDAAATRLREMFRENFAKQGFDAYGIEAVL